MNFFVPIFEEHGRLFWNVVSNGLFCRYRFTTGRRIRALLRQGDEDHEESIIVGEELPGGEEGDVVLVIQESSFFPGTMFFVCTLGMYLDKAPPLAVALATGWQVEDFNAEPPARPPRTGKRARRRS